MSIDKELLSRVEFIEFKQQVLLLKHPSHKATVFAELTLYEFLSIRDYVENFEYYLENGHKFDFKSFESGLYDLIPKLKAYPESSVLISKILMNISNFNKLFDSNN
ncbi:hypothetical protein [Paraclostridium bifermentans]|uniref:hypothetical protein n=1 Tax=Paraclostridium bifermentans TaxID=1490 RepID=UPI000DF7722C|nr:hypothetical protein [Paraclostridium bifermentans]MBS5954335.1 hypothetical protein [Paraclostridium bifermentans]MBU5289168.1 hypothetical protein [Paraclostridium bifermentans]RDC51130.1 hypothetical protein DVA85_15285 [Acinetobacter sp. RIT592]